MWWRWRASSGRAKAVGIQGPDERRRLLRLRVWAVAARIPRLKLLLRARVAYLLTDRLPGRWDVDLRQIVLGRLRLWRQASTMWIELEHQQSSVLTPGNRSSRTK